MILKCLGVLFFLVSARPLNAQYSYTASSVFSVKVNGTTVFTEYYKTVPDELTSDGSSIRWPLENVSFCHFNFTGVVTVEITCSKSFTNYNLSPKRYGISSTRSGNKITFTIDKPGKFNINMNNDQTVNEQLFIFADIHEDLPDLTNPNVKNIMSYGANNSGTVDNTTIIQNAINGLSSNQTLYFPEGQYLCKGISLKSNMKLYLAKKAILLGTKSHSDYSSNGCFVKINNCVNTEIKGYGRINLRGEEMQNNYGSNSYIRNIVVSGTSSNILLQDFFSLDPPRLNMEIAASNVTIRNVKAMSTQAGHNTDGIDPWNCSNLLMDNCFIYGRDDAIAVKSFTSINSTITQNIFISNSLFSSLESCMKVGTETERDSINNVIFENCDALYAGYAMSLWSYDVSKVQNIYFRNIGVDRLKPSPYTNQGVNFYFEANPRNGTKNPKGIYNVLLRKIYCESAGLNKSYISGNDGDSKVDLVNFDDVYIANTLVTNSNKNTYFNVGSFVTNLNYGTFAGYGMISVESTQNQITEGQTTTFKIKRQGSVSNSVTVNYYIRGNASMGYDYTNVTNSVTFAANETEKTVTIASTSDTYTEGIEQVCIVLLASTTRSYMLTTNFTSVVNIKDSNYSGGDIITSARTYSIEKPIFSVFPNPTSDKINFHNLKRGSTVTLSDISGKLLKKFVANSNVAVMDCRGFASGVYVLTIDKSSKKIMITR